MKKLSFKESVYWIVTAIICIIIIARDTNIGNIGVDYTWHYYIAHFIKEGYVLYKDVFDVTTPLFFTMMSLPLHIHDSYTYFMLWEGIYSAIAILLLAYMMKRLCPRITVIRIAVLLWIMCSTDMEYNLMVILLYLFSIGIIVFYAENKGRFTRRILVLLGIMCGLMILTKHTHGLLYTGVLGCVFVWFAIRKLYNVKIKDIIYPMIACLATVIPFVVYLIRTSTFKLFIEASAKCAKRFSDLEYTADKGWLSIYIISLVICITFAIIKKDNINTLLCISAIGSAALIYPIINKGHILKAILVPVVAILYMIKDYKVPQAKEWQRLLVRYGSILFFCALFYHFALRSLYAILSYPIYPLNGVGDGFHTAIIKESSVYNMAKYIYMHPENIYYSPEFQYDTICMLIGIEPEPSLAMFTVAGTGYKEPLEVMLDLNTSDNVFYYLYDDDINAFYQTPKEVREYIKTNGVIVETLPDFNVYKLPRK